jgi:hypothetical protein
MSFVLKNPPAIPADTTAEVWVMQMAAISQRTPAERMNEWQALNEAIAQMEAAAVKRRHPEYTDREIFLALVRQRYGDELFSAAWPKEPFLAP